MIYDSTPQGSKYSGIKEERNEMNMKINRAFNHEQNRDIVIPDINQILI